MKVKAKISSMKRVESKLSEPPKVKVIITDNDYVRIVRCDENEDFEIFCRYFEDGIRRTNYADDMCEVFYILDVPYEFIDESK